MGSDETDRVQRMIRCYRTPRAVKSFCIYFVTGTRDRYWARRVEIFRSIRGAWSSVVSHARTALTCHLYTTTYSFSAPFLNVLGATRRFRFSRDLFIAGLVPQIISASQMIVISRILGLDAAGVWSVCIKSFNMARLVICRVYDSCGAGF